MSEYLLEMKNITKTFPGVKALDNVNLNVRAGTVHALMGENGAGKSTLMKCLFGIYNPDGGEIFLEGKKANIHSARQAMDQGIAMVHQELHPIRFRSVMENVYLGRFPGHMGVVDQETATLDAFRLKPGPRNDKRFGQHIDYIYVSPGVRVLDYATVPDMRKGGRLYPSDHFPIVATVEI